MVFVRRQRRLADPLIDLRLFRVPAFSASLATYLLGTLVTFGSYVVHRAVPAAGARPVAAVRRAVDAALVGGFVVGSLLAPVLARAMRTGVRDGGGLLLAAVGFVAFTRVVEARRRGLVIASTIFSLGLSPVFTLGDRPDRRRRARRACRRRRGDLGDQLRARRRAGDRRAGQHRNGDLPRRAGAGPSSPAFPQSARRAALDTLGGAVAAAAQHLSDAARALLLDTARAAFTHTVQITLWLCAAVSLATAVLAAVALRRR